MSQQLPHLKFSRREGSKSSYMFGLSDRGAGLNLGPVYYHHSALERHPNLVLKFEYLKVLDNVGPFNISGLYVGK